MDFNTLAWAAFCFYYRSVGDTKYGKLMKDVKFLDLLRNAPAELTPAEFEEKVLLGYIQVQNYDLLIGHKLAESILKELMALQSDVDALRGKTLINCDLSDNEAREKINRVYSTLCTVNGLWLTGASKIAHLLNDNLFVMLNLNISNHFELLQGNTSLTNWLGITQQNALEVTIDFQSYGHDSSPEGFLSDKLGYKDQGYQKSLVKFLDEYYWLKFGDNLPVPPKWIPELMPQVELVS